MFGSNSNTSGIRSEYSSIATRNVTTTVDNLHTAQTHLQATENALQQQKTQATSTRNTLQQSENQASNLESQDQADAGQRRQQHPAPGDRAAASPGPCGPAGGGGGVQCQGGPGASRPGSAVSAPSFERRRRLAARPLRPPQPRFPQVRCRHLHPARWVRFRRPNESRRPRCLGREHAGRLRLLRPRGVGIRPGGHESPARPGAQYDDTTHIPLADIEPGDLLFYGPGGDEHVAMYVGGGSMIEAPYTGASVWITGVRTGSTLLVSAGSPDRQPEPCWLRTASAVHGHSGFCSFRSSLIVGGES